MERSVQYIVLGGLATVAGLWTVHLATVWTPAFAAGVALALAGVAGLGWGIAREVTTWPVESFGPN